MSKFTQKPNIPNFLSTFWYNIQLLGLPKIIQIFLLYNPSSESSDSVTSTAFYEPKEDGIFSHGPPSEYSGSVASTASYERKGIDDLFKPSHSDAELSELASLTSSKTGPESGRVTPDLPR